MATKNTDFSFLMLVEGEGALFLLALKRLRTLYPGDYAQGATSTTPQVQK